MTARKLTPWILAVLALLLVMGSLRPVKPQIPVVDWQTFGELPAVEGGRIKPLDSVARNNLRILRGKQNWVDSEGQRRPAIEWLAMVMLAPEQAAKIPVFRIDHPEVVGILGMRNEERKYFAFEEIEPHWETIATQASQVNPEAQVRTSYERALVRLSSQLSLYNSLSLSAQPPPFLGRTALAEYASLEGLVAQYANPQTDEQREMAPQAINLMGGRYAQLAQVGSPLLVPPPAGVEDVPANWQKVGGSLLDTLETGIVDPVLVGYARLSESFAAEDWPEAQAALAGLYNIVAQRHTPLPEVGFEVFFNESQPFIAAMSLYVLIFLMVCVSFLVWPKELQRGAFILLLFTVLVHTYGIAARVYIQNYPPVTNLYSSAIFVGWFAAVLAVVLEGFYRMGIGTLMAAAIGFPTLIVAQNLGTSGDTMEMMRAVLDDNFWLTTHVLTVTMGYSATLLAGALAAAYIVGRFCGMRPEIGRAIERMTYGIVCFGLLFSFVGTVLGGIWADQSWGRFWGWDPKENGALMIVLWNALVLHVRWGKLLRPVGFMQVVLVGNIITLWSWFGTNLLGVGLHAYGFTDKGALALMLAMLLHLAIIGMGFALKPVARKPGVA